MTGQNTVKIVWLFWLCMVAQVPVCAQKPGNRPALSQQMAEAVRQADYPTVRKLLAKGADPNTHLDGYPVLMLAVRSPRILKLLIQYGSDLESREEGTGQTALIYAAIFFKDATTLLLKHGARVNARSNDGTTALINAARYCRTENVRVLLRYGAKVQTRNQRGETALSVATGRRRAGFEEYREIVSLLKAYARRKTPKHH